MMMELYSVTYNGKPMGQTHADSWLDAVWTIRDRMMIPNHFSMDGWDAELAPPESFIYISPSTEGY